MDLVSMDLKLLPVGKRIWRLVLYGGAHMWADCAVDR